MAGGRIRALEVAVKRAVGRAARRIGGRQGVSGVAWPEVLPIKTAGDDRRPDGAIGGEYART